MTINIVNTFDNADGTTGCTVRAFVDSGEDMYRQFTKIDNYLKANGLQNVLSIKMSHDTYFDLLSDSEVKTYFDDIIVLANVVNMVEIIAIQE